MDETIKVVLEIDKETFNRIKGYVEIDHFEHDIVGYTMKRLAGGTILNEVEAEDCRSLKDIKEMIERKADALDGQMLDAGGICIGLYFAIANDLPTVYPKSDKPIRSHWHGHWIDCDKSDDYSADGYDCSVCGVNAEYATSYCPNCGAKMEGEEQTDEL